MPFIKTTSNTNGSVYTPDNMDTITLRRTSRFIIIRGIYIYIERERERKIWRERERVRERETERERE